MLKTVIEEYGEDWHQAEADLRCRNSIRRNVTGSLYRGLYIIANLVQSALIPSVVARPLHGEVPTIDLVMGYNKSNTSPMLKKFLLGRMSGLFLDLGRGALVQILEIGTRCNEPRFGWG